MRFRKKGRRKDIFTLYYRGMPKNTGHFGVFFLNKCFQENNIPQPVTIVERSSLPL
jgi:hypothetical protein